MVLSSFGLLAPHINYEKKDIGFLRFAEHGAILFCGVGNPESKRLDCTLLALATFPFNRERFKNGTKVQRDRPSTDPSAEADGK